LRNRYGDIVMHDGLPFQQNIREGFLCRSSLSEQCHSGLPVLLSQ
jgi:hypothetical protein